jgi:hypothetical protein
MRIPSGRVFDNEHVEIIPIMPGVLERGRLIFDMIGEVIHVRERLETTYSERVRPRRAHRGGFPGKHPS